MLDDYTRAHVNRAIDDALHPRGMSIHNGKTSIDAATLQRLVTMIDRGTEASLKAQERIAALEAENERLRGTLVRLACLGNGDRYGNSDGNMIARAALEDTDAR